MFLLDRAKQQVATISSCRTSPVLLSNPLHPLCLPDCIAFFQLLPADPCTSHQPCWPLSLLSSFRSFRPPTISSLPASFSAYIHAFFFFFASLLQLFHVLLPVALPPSTFPSSHFELLPYLSSAGPLNFVSSHPLKTYLIILLSHLFCSPSTASFLFSPTIPACFSLPPFPCGPLIFCPLAHSCNDSTILPPSSRGRSVLSYIPLSVTSSHHDVPCVSNVRKKDVPSVLAQTCVFKSSNDFILL